MMISRKEHPLPAAAASAFSHYRIATGKKADRDDAMADSKIPPTFKSLLPFVRRAEELERDSSRPESKLIAYYCRQYAMEMGIKLRENDSSNESTNYLLALMDRLEEDKSKLPTFTQEEGKEICEDFALEIFTKADDEDRAGRADKNTARTFYAAGTFFDILSQFGDVSEDMLEKRRYCKYKAATILKAIKEGTAPTPGPPGSGAGYATGDGYSDDVPAARSQPTMPDISSMSISGASSASAAPSPSPSDAFPSFTSSAASFGPGVGSSSEPQSNSWNSAQPSSAPSPPAYSPPPPPPQPAYTPPPQPQQPAYTPPPSAPITPVAIPPPAPTHTPYVPQTLPARNRAQPLSQNEINDAMECAKFAIAALKVKDIELAIQRLEMALKSIK